MKYKIIIFTLLCLIATISTRVVLAQSSPSLPIPIVCIDPGHGGSDTGAVYQTLAEKNVTLDIGLKLQSLLQNASYSVVMTRTTDIGLDNSTRAVICNNANANILVSIHLNASTNHTIDYTEGLFGKPKKDKSITTTIQNSLASGLGITSNGVIQYADGVLIKSNMPATLQETVFITSDYEYGLLVNGTETRQQQIAQALLDGIKRWFGN